METVTARRPLKTRQAGWARTFAQFLARHRVSPNGISILSIFCAAGAGVAVFFSARLGTTWRVWLLLAAAAGIQLRLLCNMLDGMVAVEGGLQTKSGEVFNDLPDRISDAFILIPVGYAVFNQPYGPLLGWLAALLAIFTAYVRMMGGAAGLKQSFMGPMAKPHRMFALTVGCVLSILETWYLHRGIILWLDLIIINLGCVITIWRRTANIIRELEAR